MNPLTAITTLPPEMQMLCACCRVHPRDEDVRLQTSLAALVDADKLLALAIRQRVEPLLYHNLKRHAPGTFPEALLQTLAARAKRNTFNTLNAIRLNVQLARMLREHGIPFLPLKGVTLAQRYYSEVGVRHCNDIDFWVPEHSLDIVRSLLIEQGCLPDAEQDFEINTKRSRAYRKFFRACQKHEVLIDPNGMHLEVHWKLTTNSKGINIDPYNLLTSGETIEVSGESMTMMTAVPLLFYLCDHGAGHGWFRLKWLFDLPQILESRDWDWPQVLVDAKRANCVSSLLLGLQLAHILFAWDIPEPVAVAMRRQHLLNWQARIVLKKLSQTVSFLNNPTEMQKVFIKLFRFTFAESFGFIWNELKLSWLSKYYRLRHKSLKG